MGRDSREVWEKRVERWRDSGLTATEFADEVGVNAKTLSYWKWRLGRPTGVGTKLGRRRAAPTRRMRPMAVPFVEVSGVTSAPALDAVSAGTFEPFEILAASGLRVRVPVRFDDAALARLLTVVR